VYAELGKIDRAIEDYTAALAVDSTSEFTYHARGRMYLRRREFAEAVADFNKALEHVSQPKGRGGELVAGQLHSDVAWLLATCPDTALRDPDRALQLATKAVKLCPFVTQALGVARYRAGDWKSSIEILEKSTKDACSWSFLAMAHWQLGNKEEATRCYQEAVAWLGKNKKQEQAFRRFCLEATELLGVEHRLADVTEAAESHQQEFLDHMIFDWCAWQDPIW
jgi:tetratricopeptide (TPR) repeat protein